MICESCIKKFSSGYFNDPGRNDLFCRNPECLKNLPSASSCRFLNKEQQKWWDEYYVEEGQLGHQIGTTFCCECKSKLQSEIDEKRKTELQRFQEKYNDRMIFLKEAENEELKDRKADLIVIQNENNGKFRVYHRIKIDQKVSMDGTRDTRQMRNFNNTMKSNS